MVILIKITSNESPQSIFKKQADAEALEKWARESPPEPTMSKVEFVEYLMKTGRDYMKSKIKFLL